MNFQISLPLRLGVSFYAWDRDKDDYLKLLKKLEPLKLFVLSLELDERALNIFERIKDSLTFSAFKKTLIIDYQLYKEALPFLSYFNDIEVSIPFNGKEKDIQKFLSSREEPFTISFLLTSQNIPTFEKIIQFGKTKNIKIKVPNPNLVRYGKELSEIYLKREDLKKLEHLKTMIKGIDMEIHDYFLAKLFALPDADRFAGCQAGRLLGHIENDLLYPCSSIPQAIGSLLEYDFEFLWKKAYNIVDDLRKKCCLLCQKRENCHLGCIGNAFFLGDKRDPLCEE